MLMPFGNQATDNQDHAWSIMLSQLERATQGQPPLHPRHARERRYVVRLVGRSPAGAAGPDAAEDARVFDAMSCLLMACSRVGRRLAVTGQDDERPLYAFATRVSAVRLAAHLEPALAACNERLRDTSLALVVTPMDAH